MSGKLPGKVSVPASVPVGSQIAGYRLEDRICAGGMAVVFRAVDERLGRRVALKVLPPELAADGEFRERFIRESRAATAVDDPHLIPVYQAGEADDVLFIAMRYVAGGDVRSLVRREGPLSPERMAAIVSPVASALDAAHAAGLVHRDVKPANMLLDVRQGRPDHVYLGDFGISRQMLPAAGLTGTGHFLGTADYCAPEQIQGLPVDGRADQYALACTVFELLSGQPPFRRDEAAAVIWAQMTEPPPSLTSRQPGFPAAVTASWRRHWRRGQRFATRRARHSLTHCARRSALRSITQAPRRSPRPTACKPGRGIAPETPSGGLLPRTGRPNQPKTPASHLFESSAMTTATAPGIAALDADALSP